MKHSDRFSSFSHAWRGLKLLYTHELNFQIEIGCAALVVVLAWLLRITGLELLILIIVIGLVLALEAINSMMERLIDMVKPRMHHYVGDIKDITAALVLIAALVSVCIGAVIIGPKLAAALLRFFFVN